MKEKVNQLIQEYGLGHEQNNILESMYECVRCIPARSGYIALGGSKFGGYPHLPTGINVPVYKGQPLTLLAQWNLADIPFIHKDLPRNGMLYFFYYCSPSDADEYIESPWGECEEREGWRVVYTEKTEGLEIVQEEGAYAYQESTLTFEKVEYIANNIYFEEDDDYEKYDGLRDEVQQTNTLHQLLGTPQEVQNDVFEECEYYAKNGVDAKEWELLFQIDSDEEFLDMWGDCGMLYFCMPSESLRNRRFEDAWMIMQCY